MPSLNIVEEGNAGLHAWQSRTARRPERRNAGLFEHPDDLDIVDVPVGVHVAPAHGHEDLNAPGVSGAQLCTAVVSSAKDSSASSPANCDMYRR